MEQMNLARSARNWNNEVNILNSSIRKTRAFVVFSFLFVFLISSIASTQGTYGQKIKMEGDARPHVIINTTDGGNALLFDIFENSARVLLRRVNASGKKVWQRELHLENQSDPLGFDVGVLGAGVAELSNGGYILTGARGELHSDSWLTKLSLAGRIDWQKRLFENGFSSILSSVVSSADGGFFADGNRRPDIGLSGQHGVIVASFDSSGDLRWGKVFSHDFQGSLFRLPPSLFITSDQELIVVSQLLSPQTPFDYAGTLVLKVDAGGNLVWKKFLEKNGLRFTSGAVTTDGGCILLFSSNFSGVFSIRLNSNGDVVWKKRFRVDSQSSEGFSVAQNADGGFTIAGEVFSDSGEIFLAKLDSAGKVVSTVSSDAISVYYQELFLAASDSGYVLFGRSVFGSSEDAFLLKLDANANLPGCNLFSPVRTERRKFGTLKASSPAITTSNWTPQEGTLDFSSKKVKVTISPFCP
jgi:hypothetical protein